MALPPTLGLVLAGGRSRRMGGSDKVLLSLAGMTLLEHVAQRLDPQCDGVIVSANRGLPHLPAAPFPIAPDCVAGHLGPLAGILTALEWAAVHRPGVAWVASVPGDTPFIPPDLVRVLHETRRRAGRPLACASSGGRVHFTVGLWPVALRHDLRRTVLDEGCRKMSDWVERHGYAEASWPVDPVDPFFNVNTPDDWKEAQALVERGAAR